MSFAETNKLKKGTRVLLKNGWFATLEDNKRGAIRLATVEGIYTETGSIYATDIAAYLEKTDSFSAWVKLPDTNENIVELLLKAWKDET